jgi:hypothetical protein
MLLPPCSSLAALSPLSSVLITLLKGDLFCSGAQTNIDYAVEGTFISSYITENSEA